MSRSSSSHLTMSSHLVEQLPPLLQNNNCRKVNSLTTACWPQQFLGRAAHELAAMAIGKIKGIDLYLLASIHNGDMEKILLDAQNESKKEQFRGSSLIVSPRDKANHVWWKCTPARSIALSQKEEAAEGERGGCSEEKCRLGVDWSNRPENVSPEVEGVLLQAPSCFISMRKSEARKKGGSSPQSFLKVIPFLSSSPMFWLWVVSIYICKMTKHAFCQHLLREEKSPWASVWLVSGVLVQ